MPDLDVWHVAGGFWASIEATFVLFLVLKSRRAWRHYKAQRPTHGRLDALEQSFIVVGLKPWQARFFATEWLILSFALTGWFKPVPSTKFSHHRGSQWGAVVAVFAFLTLVEGVAVHLMVQRWSIVVAWVLTALTAYGLLWLVGDYQAIRHSRTTVTPDGWHFEFGTRGRGLLPLRDIGEVTLNADASPKALDLVLLGGGDTVSVMLREPREVVSWFGRRTNVSVVRVSVDDASSFVATLTEAVRGNEIKEKAP